MADEPNANPAPGNEGQSATNSTAAQAAPSAQNTPDNTKMAEELGKLKAENESLKTYYSQVDPVIQTIWSDQNTLKQVTDIHNKRLGITPKDPAPNQAPATLPSPELQRIEKKVNDSRNADVVREVNTFQTKYGIDKMEEEQKKDINTKVGAMLMDMVDPMGNKKELKEVLEDIPLSKLPKLLDDAYFLVTKDQQIAHAKNQGKQEANQENLGAIGSLSSTSANTDNLELTGAQKKTADNLGIPHDKYLARVKEIGSKGNQLY